MNDDLNRAKLFAPYSALTEYRIWAINTLVEEDPNPDDAEAALNLLLDDVETKCPSASERDAKSSIANAAVEVAKAITETHPIIRSKIARFRVSRWFSKDLATTGPEGSSDDFEPPQRAISHGRQTGEEPEL